MMAINDAFGSNGTGLRMNRRYLDEFDASSRHEVHTNVLFCDGHLESPAVHFLFAETNDATLVRWNCDRKPHREALWP